MLDIEFANNKWTVRALEGTEWGLIYDGDNEQTAIDCVLELAKSGAVRKQLEGLHGVDPSSDDLGEALKRYTDPNDPEFDPEFNKKIRRLRPDWFSHETN